MKRQRESKEPVNTQADVARRGLVSLNKLDYNLQPDLSVCVHRSHKKHFFQQTSYTANQKAIIIFNSGAEYVDLQNSYLSFQVVPDGTLADTVFQGFGVGSAMNLIQRVILTSRSGDELERIEDVNLLSVVLDRYTKSKDYRDTILRLQGMNDCNKATPFDAPLYPKTPHIFNADYATVITGQPVREAGLNVVIPFPCLAGLFRSFDRLAPSMLMSGMRMEIHFETAARAFVNTAASVTNYTVKNIECSLDQYQLTDSIMRVLNEEASLRGLEMPFTTFYHHRANTKADTTDMNIEIRKAVSRALGVLHKVSPSVYEGKADNMKSVRHALVEYQVRVGSLYFPQQPIRPIGDTNDTSYECYHHTMRGLGKFKTNHAPGVMYEEFKGIGTQTEANIKNNTEGGMAAIYTDLERSNVQKLTGIAVNNSRVAELRLKRVSGLPFTTNSQIDCWLHYVRLLRVFLQNVEVEE
jgi:hypothetical protein